MSRSSLDGLDGSSSSTFDEEWTTTTTTTTTTPRTLFEQMGTNVGSLWRESPDELWKAYLLKFLDSYSYFSFSIIFTLFLTTDFGYSDTVAGTIYGAWGALITIYGLVAGCWVDRLGVAKSLRLGFVLTLVARIGIFFTSSRTTLLFYIGLVLPAGNCLGIPVLTTGIRRYTTESNRGFAFGLFYVVMNVAALLSGPVVDSCTILYQPTTTTDGDAATTNNDGNNNNNNRIWTFSGYRLVVLTGVVANAIAVVVSFTVREVKLVPGEAITAFAPRSADSITTILQETLYTRRFWRFLAVCIITLNVRMIFRHLDATLPKYMIREFGQQVPKGTIYAINPAIIILLVPIVTAATSKLSPLLIIHHGSYVSAISVFVLVLSTSLWSSIVFVTLLSIGEAIWSPRLYDYTMKVCQEGREGTYMALSSAPLFLAQLPVGFMSGYLLERYCPEIGPRNSKMMWFVIGATTMASPILMTVFWKYISYDDDDRDDTTNTIELANAAVEYSEVSRLSDKVDRHGSFYETTHLPD